MMLKRCLGILASVTHKKEKLKVIIEKMPVLTGTF
jgi:hypothetical protein